MEGDNNSLKRSSDSSCNSSSDIEVVELVGENNNNNCIEEGGNRNNIVNSTSTNSLKSSFFFVPPPVNIIEDEESNVNNSNNNSSNNNNHLNREDKTNLTTIIIGDNEIIQDQWLSDTSTTSQIIHPGINGTRPTSVPSNNRLSLSHDTILHGGKPIKGQTGLKDSSDSVGSNNSSDGGQRTKRKIQRFDNDPEIERKLKEKTIDMNSIDPLGENLYTPEEVGWKGWSTIKLMGQRYMFGGLVAVIVSFFVYILSLPNWTNQGEEYLNSKTFSLFIIFGSVTFGPLYVTFGFYVAYGINMIRTSKVLYYSVGITIVYMIFYGVLSALKISYWYYYIDVIGVVACFLVAQVTFSYFISCTVQQKEAIAKGIKVVIDKTKAKIVAFNYTAPDIVVTICTVVYMFFLLPVYFSIQNDLIRLGWRLVVHPVYWVSIVIIARQFLTRDICTEDIMLNSNIVLHTFFHHQTLGRIFVYTFSGDSGALTEIGMVISAVEDIIIRCLSLYRDEWVVRFFQGKEKAHLSVYSQQNLQLRAAILNIQVALEFSGLITAPLFIFLFQKHRMLFHFFDDGNFVATTLLYQTFLSIGLDILSELFCTFIECKYYKLPIVPTWQWIKSNRIFMGWLVYGSITMGFFGMIWTCARVPRALLCSTDDICSCNSIIASSLPAYCTLQNN